MMRERERSAIVIYRLRAPVYYIRRANVAFSILELFICTLRRLGNARVI